MKPRARPRRATVICGVCLDHDAISDSVSTTVLALTANSIDTLLLAYRVDQQGLPHEIVGSSAQILRHPHYLASDLLIWHFGIYYPLFDALLMGNGRARNVVHFHNVTPSHLVPIEARPLIEASCAQMHNISSADIVWGVSDFNLRALDEAGVVVRERLVLPMPVDTETGSTATRQPRTAVLRLLFVGRFVPSKGVLDLLECLEAAVAAGHQNVELDLIGNERFSDPDYLQRVRAIVQRPALRDRVRLLGEVSDRRKRELFAETDALVLPSYHEGFGVPLIEAFAHGCIVVAYSAGSVSETCAGLALECEPGDRVALTRHLSELAVQWRSVGLGSEPTIPLAGGAVSLRAYVELARDHASKYSTAAFVRALTVACDREFSRLDAIAK